MQARLMRLLGAVAPPNSRAGTKYGAAAAAAQAERRKVRREGCVAGLPDVCEAKVGSMPSDYGAAETRQSNFSGSDSTFPYSPDADALAPNRISRGTLALGFETLASV